ncbi:MAG: type II secretion system F family protein [Legionellales bacterium]|jgi:type IV pilus assembly protein PilC
MGDTKIFLWQGIDRNGSRVQGEIYGENAGICKVQLINREITPLQIRIKKVAWSALKPHQNKIKHKQIIDFNKQLAILINANIPLVTALEIISNEAVPQSALHKLIITIKKDVENGTALSEAIHKYSRYFSALFCSLVNIGETAGVLDKILTQIAEYDEKMLVQKHKIFKALFYPAMVLTVALAVTAILLVFVIPQFKSMFAGFGAALPYYTQLVIHIAEFVKSKGIFIILAIGVLLFLIIKCRKRYQYFSNWTDKIILHVPIVGTILEKNLLLRYVQTLAITFHAGLPLLEALNTVAAIMHNWVYQQAVHKTKNLIADGESLHSAMQKQNIFPKRMLQLLAIGEESGKLDAMLDELAKHYERELNKIIETMNDLLEPVIMLVLGIIVGGLIIGMYLPIFRLGNIV